MKRTRRQALQTRDQILDAAERVFAGQGVARASLEQDSMVLPGDAEYLADGCIGMLRQSPSLRRGCDDAKLLE